MSETQKVEVQERQVSIRVLTIGSKQITQSLYKQFPIEDVIDKESGQLKGKIWGWVSLHGEKIYWTKDCANDPDHLHVIWERDGQLRRCLVFNDLPKASFKPEGTALIKSQSYQECLSTGQIFI